MNDLSKKAVTCLECRAEALRGKATVVAEGSRGHSKLSPKPQTHKLSLQPQAESPELTSEHPKFCTASRVRCLGLGLSYKVHSSTFIQPAQADPVSERGLKITKGSRSYNVLPSFACISGAANGGKFPDASRTQHVHSPPIPRYL